MREPIQITDAWKVGRGTIIATDMVRDGSEDVHYHVVVLRDDQIARIAEAVVRAFQSYQEARKEQP